MGTSELLEHWRALQAQARPPQTRAIALGGLPAFEPTTFVVAPPPAAGKVTHGITYSGPEHERMIGVMICAAHAPHGTMVAHGAFRARINTSGLHGVDRYVRCEMMATAIPAYALFDWPGDGVHTKLLLNVGTLLAGNTLTLQFAEGGPILGFDQG